MLPYHDLHNASPATFNPRLTDLATLEPRLERQGVHLHWMLPRAYRSGTASDDHDGTKDGRDSRAPAFRNAPDRWLIIRRLHANSFKPEDAIKTEKQNELTAWVIESNRLRNIQTFDRDVDIELECAPFVKGESKLDSLDGQAEIFIGRRFELETWKEEFSPQTAGNYVPLNVVGAANPFFADYVPHNSNVFSMLDNFGWKNPDGTKSYLSQATASYYVIGWHANPDDDPVLGSTSLSSVLRSLSMQMKLELPEGTKVDVNRLLCHGAIYTVQYNSESTTVNVPANDAAQKFANKLSHPVTVGATALDAVLAYVRAHQEELKTAKNLPADDAEIENIEADIILLETLLLKQADDVDSQQEAIDMLSANNFQPAEDSGCHWHFSAADADLGQAGTASRTDKVFDPSGQQLRDLASLNAAQLALDSVTRELQAERWNLFARWWQFVADPDLQDVSKRDTLIARTKAQFTIVDSLRKKKLKLLTVRDNCLIPLGGTDEKTRLVQRGTQGRFSTQKDPTILVPGVTNPWPVDWTLPLKVRLSSQVQPNQLPDALPDGWKHLGDLLGKQITPRVPAAIQSGIKVLISEFFNLHPTEGSLDSWKEPNPGVYPLYHDHIENHAPVDSLDAKGQGRDQWKAQPWFPLFMEWEIRYYHIPFDSWGFMEVVSSPTVGNLKHWRYGIKDKASIQDLANDTVNKHVDERVITGRVLILPQPGFNLKVNIQQLFNSTSRSDLPDDLKYEPATNEDKKLAADKDQAKRDLFLARISQMNYLSAPLSGFQDHLVTKLNGTHLKPSYRAPGQAVVPFQAAINAAKDGAGFDNDQIKAMDIETDKVPFANHVPFPDDSIAPFKPACHGQFKFTRLDIFDKFGQAISAIDPTPTNQIPPLYPVLSEYFHPQHLSSDPDTPDFKQAKTVGKDPFGSCQFAQYPPTINQDARINAAFMHWDEKAGNTGLWRPCSEWKDENPIWGYLVVNYAEYALQVFLPDGQFYREIRQGGPSGTTETPSWAPFEQPENGLKDLHGDKLQPKLVQLDALLARFKDRAYLKSFIQMVNNSLDSIAHTPNTYADFLSSIVGRPLALANIGYSLELAQPPFKNQSTVSKTPNELDLIDYNFPLKFGDADRVYDGLVGFFGPADNFENFGDELNLNTVYTYYPSGDPPTEMIQPENYPSVKPYHLNLNAVDEPDLLINKVDDNSTPDAVQAAADELAEKHWAKMKIAGVLFDPFSKLHIYSGILPIQSLQLPPWSLQAAMQSMTAFFSMGPLLITTPDLQKQYNPKRNLTKDINLLSLKEVEDTSDDKPVEGKPPPPLKFKGIPIPAIQSAEWNWLQPFARVPDTTSQADSAPSATENASSTVAKPVSGGGNNASSGSRNNLSGTGDTSSGSVSTAGGNVQSAGATPGKLPTKETHWNPFVITHLDNKPKFEKGPYTAIEGYLQLKKPIMGPPPGQQMT